MRPAAAWVLFWLGDKVSKLDVMHEHRWWTWYPVYNFLMGWSSRIQGPSDNGPWGATEGKEPGR